MLKESPAHASPLKSRVKAAGTANSHAGRDSSHVRARFRTMEERKARIASNRRARTSVCIAGFKEKLLNETTDGHRCTQIKPSQSWSLIRVHLWLQAATLCLP